MRWDFLCSLVLVGVLAISIAEKDNETIDEIIAVVGDFKHGKVNPNGKNLPSGRKKSDGKGVITEYDIMLQLPELIEENESSKKPADKSSQRKKRAARQSQSLRWPSATIPYTLASNFTSSSLSIIQQAITEYERYTCLKIRPRTTETDYLSITNAATGCWSYVGLIGGAQELNLQQGNPGCTNVKRTAIHEFLHAAGCWHEQSRTDRGSYVTINSANIQAGQEHNFDIETDEITYGISYDYRSVMHYGRSAFSSNGLDTVTTLDPAYQTTIGTAPTLSFADIRMVNSMYNCAGFCPPANCPSNGFQGFNCSCFCPSTDPNNPVVNCGEVCLSPNQACNCHLRTGACNGIPNSLCNTFTSACECAPEYVLQNGVCTLISSVTCTSPNVDCKCSLNANACSGVANTVCDAASDSCLCASGFGLVDGQCVDINTVPCDQANKMCFCSSKGTSACASIPNSSCQAGNGSCVCNLGFYNNNGVCTAAQVCTTLNVGCNCQVQGANACAVIPNSVCNSATGACVCSPTSVQSGSSCITAFISDGSAVSPFVVSASSNTNWLPTTGVDNNAFGVPSNNKYLYASGSSTSNLAIIETTPLGSRNWCFNAGVWLSNARLTISSTTSSGTASSSLSSSGNLGYFYGWTRSYNASSTIKFTITGRAQKTGSWFIRLDPLKIFPC